MKRIVLLILFAFCLSSCSPLVNVKKRSESDLHTFIEPTNMFAVQSTAIVREEILSRHPDWPDDIKVLIRKSGWQMGMIKDQVLASIGKPLYVNETVNAFGRSEQWVYSGNYLYFSNGKLTSWQNSH